MAFDDRFRFRPCSFFGAVLKPRTFDARIREVVDRINADLLPSPRRPKAWTRRAVHLSFSRFLHLFKQETGVTFRAFRAWKRARSLLRHVRQTTTLTDIALDTGYPDSTHFSHSIRQVYGLRPSDILAGSRRLALHDAVRRLLARGCKCSSFLERRFGHLQVLQLLISGIAQGCIYGLIALGFVLIYKATETVSFAQGELMMLGAFTAFAAMSMLGWPFWLAAVLAVVAMAAFGVLLELVVIRPILGQPQFSIVMLTIGIGYVARGLITMIPAIGTETHALPVPYKDEIWNVGALVLNVEQMVVIGSTAVLCALLFAMFRYSKLGIAMQASSQNQLAAYYMGIPVKRLNGLVWGLAAGVAAIAGMLLAPITFVHANMGFIGLKAFPAAVVGGFGSLPGAIVGGLVIGIVESFAGFYLPDGFKDTAAYIVVLIMLMFKPNGLFGEKLRKKV